MKKLSIIMPQYSENEQACFGSLSMWNSQINVGFGDYEIIIVNDAGPEKLSKKFLNSFKNLDIRYIISPENAGPGIARQIGLDAATGEYVFFQDIDDVCFSCVVLSYFETYIYPQQKDIVHTQWFQCAKIPGQAGYLYQAIGRENTWMFGKFFKRSFLKLHKIQFHPELRVHEDSFFNRVAVNCQPNYEYIEFPTYIWRQAEDSITRREGASYAYTSYAVYIRAVDLLCEELVIRNKAAIPETVLQQILYSYISMQNPEWFEERAADWVGYTKEWLCYFYKKWESYLADFTQDHWRAMYANVVREAHTTPKQGYESFIEEVLALNITEKPEMRDVNITAPKKNSDLL